MKTPIRFLAALCLTCLSTVPHAARADDSSVADAMSRMRGKFALAGKSGGYHACFDGLAIDAAVVAKRLVFTIDLKSCGIGGANNCFEQPGYSDKSAKMRVAYGLVSGTGAPYIRLSQSSFNHGGDGYTGNLVGWSKQVSNYALSADGGKLTVMLSDHDMSLMPYSDTGHEPFSRNSRNVTTCTYTRKD